MATPSAQGLYHGLILQSDPINFGTQTFENQASLQDLVFKNATLANCTDVACLKGVDVAQILSVQDVVNSAAPFNVTGVPLGEVFRPQFNTSTVTVDPVSALFNNPTSLALNVSSVPLLLTYTRNEVRRGLKKGAVLTRAERLPHRQLYRRPAGGQCVHLQPDNQQAARY